VSSFKKPGFGSEIPVLGPILHHRKVAILENREAGYSQVGYRPSRNQVPGRSFDSRPIGGPDFSRVREASTRKLGCRPSGNQVSDNKSRFLGRFYVIGKGAFKKSSKKPGLWFSDVILVIPLPLHYLGRAKPASATRSAHAPTNGQRRRLHSSSCGCGGRNRRCWLVEAG
jgi:hypothetical protein